MTQSQTFTGSDVRRYQAVVLAQALLMWHRHQIAPNRAWKPVRMLATAGTITGKTYKRGEYEKAAADLRAWAKIADAGQLPKA